MNAVQATDLFRIYPSAEGASAALEALYSAPGFVYDTRVLGALEVALDRAGLLATVTA